MEGIKKGVVPRTGTEHGTRGAAWILGSSIACILCFVGLFAFLLDIGESREYLR
jgi:hypothetical protein